MESLGFKSGIFILGLESVLLVCVLAGPGVILHTLAQAPSGSSSDQLSFLDPSPHLEAAKMHLSEAVKDLQNGSSQVALTQLNMTRQEIVAAEQQLNATVICSNSKNEGFCSTAP
jgi:hypothetical protein